MNQPDAETAGPATSKGDVQSVKRDPLRFALALLLATLAAAMCMLVLALAVAVRQGSTLIGGLAGVLDRPAPTPVLSTQAVILQRLDGASELATAVYTMETVVTESRDRTLGSWTVGRTKLLYVAHGQVRAGVDLGQLTSEDITVDDDLVRVRLPPAVILDAKIDVDRSYVYDLQRSLLGPVDPDLQSRAERYAMDQIVEAACEAGILEDATGRAEMTVSALLESADVGDVEVVSAPIDPGSCSRPAPSQP